MKKAFTLIELLVVIAIIAILAAILFPVFAQAKLAAKKTAVLSNVKQVSTGMFLYMGDYDDTYFRGRSCVQGSSLNPALQAASMNGGALQGCSGGKYYNQFDHYEWQKYLLPYTKSVELFGNQLRQKSDKDWNEQGELFNQIAINLGFTGIKSTSFTDPTSVSSYGDIAPFTGGNQSGIPNVSEAALFFDNVPLNVGSFSPVLDKLENGQTATSTITGYPLAYREFWAFRMLQMTQAQCAQNPQPNGQVDASKAPAGGLNVGRADGSAKYYSAGAFLGKTPTLAQLTGGGTTTAPTCVAGNTSQGYAYTGTIDKTINFPMWGFGQ